MARKVTNTQKAFNVWGGVLAVWAIYRATIGATSSMVFDEMIFKPVVFLWPVLYYIAKIEKRSVLAELSINLKHFKSEVGLGVLIGLPAVVVVIVKSGLMLGGFTQVLQLLVIAASIAITEETLSRGLVANAIYRESKSSIKTIFQASILHIFLRVPRIVTHPGLYGDKLAMALLSEAVLSFVLTSLLIWRRNMVSVYVVRFTYAWLMLSLFYGA